MASQLPSAPLVRGGGPEPSPDRLGILGRALAPWFDAIALEPAAEELLLGARAAGDVVYTLRAKRLVDPLYLLHALARLGQPGPRWLHDHPASRLPPSAETLLAEVYAGEPSLLFLRRPRTLTSRGAYSERHVEALIAAQRERTRPILLLPVGLQWTRTPVGLRRSLVDAVFGDIEAPGAIRELLGFLWRHRGARFHVGAPVDLRVALERDGHLADRVVSKKVRWTILQHLAREERLRTGPIYRPAARTRQAVRNDPQVRRLVAQQAASGKDPTEVEARIQAMLERIAADMRAGWLGVLDMLIDLLWSRLYDGIQVDPAGLEHVRRAARRGPVVVVPSHKSHIDYLVLSQVFFKHGLIPPHVAAGENLDFWPVGTLFRRAGAFFIRRSFRADKLYAAVFAAYVRRLLREGHAIEFFIEGGRSRTGKLLAPKMGMLQMCAEPVLEGSIPDVSFVPVSIGYEKVLEGDAFLEELAGGQKRKEDVGGLLGSARFLRRRYGRVYVDFDEPLSLRAFAAARGHPLPLPPDATGGKALVHQLGHRIVFGINSVTRVTPTSVAALVLLADVRRGMGIDELAVRAERALALLRAVGARVSPVLDGDGRVRALEEALGRFVRERLLTAAQAPDGTAVYRIEDRGRVALDYYKNNILHFFVPAAVVAAAVLVAGAPGDGHASKAEVARWARRISRLLKNEVSFRVDSSFEDNFDEASALLVGRGVLGAAGETLGPTPSGLEEARELAGLLAVFFEAYRLMGEALSVLDAGPTTERRLLDEALAFGRRRVVDGRVLRAEAVAQPTLRQALSLFVNERAVLRGDGGTLRAGHAEARTRLLEELGALLRSQRQERG